MIVVNPRNHGEKNAIFRVPFGIFSTLVSVTFLVQPTRSHKEIQPTRAEIFRPTELKGPDVTVL